jgi:exonuclease III
MRIIEWNCQGAFRKKNNKILALQPDILIIPECENEAKLEFGKLTPKPTDFFWYGDSGHKGIGIFSYSDYK